MDQYTVYIVLYKSSTFNTFPENTSKPDVQINYKIIKLLYPPLVVYICTEKIPARVVSPVSESESIMWQNPFSVLLSA